MSKFITGKTSLCNIICAILLIVLLVLQFMPFWHYGETGEETLSINGYIWFPTENASAEKYFKEQSDPDFSVEKILLMPVFVLVAGFIGIIMCLWKSDNQLVGLLPAAVGIVGAWGYLAEPVFRLGNNWQLHLAVCIAIAAVAAISVFLGVKELKES